MTEIKDPKWYPFFNELKRQIEDAYSFIITSRHLFTTLLRRQHSHLQKKSQTLSPELNGGMWVFHFNCKELGEFVSKFRTSLKETRLPTDMSSFIPTLRPFTSMTDRFTDLPHLQCILLPDSLSLESFTGEMKGFIQRDHPVFPNEWQQAGQLNTKNTLLIQVAAYAVLENNETIVLIEKHCLIENISGQLITIPSPLSYYFLKSKDVSLNEDQAGWMNCLTLLTTIAKEKEKFVPSTYDPVNRKLAESFKTSILTQLSLST